MNRLARDEILHRALDMIDSPSLDAKDRPQGAIEATALSLSWLQDGLDLFLSEFPWQGVIRRANVTLSTTGIVKYGSSALPPDFNLDVRDGLLVPGRRLLRRGLQDVLNSQVIHGEVGTPVFYTLAANQLLLQPIPKENLAAVLWYYALPPLLGPGDIPTFPSDWVLVEFVRLRGKEWLNQVQPGSAMAYARQEIDRLRTAGLGGEPESTRIPFDAETIRPVGGNPYSWMGDTVPR